MKVLLIWAIRLFVALFALALFLFMVIAIWSMIGVVGDVLGWWDGWVSDR